MCWKLCSSSCHNSGISSAVCRGVDILQKQIVSFNHSVLTYQLKSMTVTVTFIIIVSKFLFPYLTLNCHLIEWHSFFSVSCWFCQLIFVCLHFVCFPLCTHVDFVMRLVEFSSSFSSSSSSSSSLSPPLLSSLSLLCRVFTVIYLKQTMFLGYIVLQLFCIYNLCYM